jgi:long-chain acyl-CoA synthetase
MLAASVLRAFPVPVFPDVSANELATYTLHGLPTMAVAEDQEQVDKLIELRERIGRPRSYTTTTAGLAPIPARALYHLIP